MCYTCVLHVLLYMCSACVIAHLELLPQLADSIQHHVYCCAVLHVTTAIQLCSSNDTTSMRLHAHTHIVQHIGLEGARQGIQGCSMKGKLLKRMQCSYVPCTMPAATCNAPLQTHLAHLRNDTQAVHSDASVQNTQHVRSALRLGARRCHSLYFLPRWRRMGKIAQCIREALGRLMKVRHACVQHIDGIKPMQHSDVPLTTAAHTSNALVHGC
jgi:hypothetical protein